MLFRLAGRRLLQYGETANFISTPIALNALEQVQAWEVREINASLSRITETIIVRTSNLGLIAPGADHRAGHMSGLRLAPAAKRRDFDDMQMRLEDKQVYLSVRGDFLRIAPHLHGNDADINRLVTALGDIFWVAESSQ